MKRSNTMPVLNHENLAGFKQKVVYHEAGHAVGVHFNSIQKNLPPVFFEIVFNQPRDSSANSMLSDLFDPHTGIARVKGGRLIESLPLQTFDALDAQSSDATDKRAFKYTDDYRQAFETDITNLLIGPLAEAKYTVLVDDEPFHQELLTTQALKNYGGDADLAVINDYLQSYTADEQEQHRILGQIFIEAFNFVNDHTNWKAISRLANHILTSNKAIIGCEEVAALLDGK
jgi:hypothetical protein